MKKCAHCKKQFEQKSSLQKYCSYECAKAETKKKSRKLTREVNKVKNNLMKEWALKVKERAGFKCEYCGITEYLNSHHIFSRSNRTTRYDLDNGMCLCTCCHTFSSKFSAHKTPAEFIEWIKVYRGLEWYEELRRKAKCCLV